MRKTALLTILVLTHIVSFAQKNSGNIESYIGAYIISAPFIGGNDYKMPSPGQLTAWESMVSQILEGDIPAARGIAKTLHYRIVKYTNTSVSPRQLLYVLEERTPQRKHWGTYIFNPSARRENVVLQAPHIKSDFNTGDEAIYCFTRLSAKAVFFNGAHRCNHDAASSCDGVTSICGGISAPYRVSDMAHRTKSVFQKTTEVVASKINNSVFIQLHGFGKKSTDPYAIMSNGTRHTPPVDYVSKIKDALFDADSTLTFKIPHVDLSWSRLLGFTNTQGRFLNNSPDPCNTSPTSATGRFVHLEQEKSKLRADSTGWHKVFTALSNVFPPTPSYLKKIQKESTCEVYPINRLMWIVKGENIQYVKILDPRGKVLVDKKCTNAAKVTLNLAKLREGLFLMHIQHNDTIIQKKIVLR